MIDAFSLLQHNLKQIMSSWQFGRDRGSQELKPGSETNRISKTVEGEVSQSAGFRFCVFIEASVLSELRWYYIQSDRRLSLASFTTPDALLPFHTWSPVRDSFTH